jgi:hypothetical protein
MVNLDKESNKLKKTKCKQAKCKKEKSSMDNGNWGCGVLVMSLVIGESYGAFYGWSCFGVCMLIDGILSRFTSY